MIVKKTGDTVEYTFEEITTQQVSGLVKLFDTGKAPEPTITRIPVEFLIAGGAQLDAIGKQLGVERRLFSSETDQEFRERVLLRYKELTL